MQTKKGKINEIRIIERPDGPSVGIVARIDEVAKDEGRSRGNMALMLIREALGARDAAKGGKR